MMHPADQPSPSTHTARRTLFISIAICIGIIALSIGALFVWGNYLSPEAQNAQAMQKNYEAYQAWQQQHTENLTKDTFGGTTPQETIQLFVDALENDDLELASKYFVLDERERLAEDLQKVTNEGKINKIIDTLRKMKKIEDPAIPEGQIIYGIMRSDSLLENSVTLQKNTQSNIWKIESI